MSLLCAKSEDSAVVELSTILESRGYDVEIVEYPQLPSAQDIISIVDLDEPFFTNIAAAKLKSFQDLATHLQNESVGMLWVTRASQILCRDPRYAQVIGAARTIRSELGVALATLELNSISSDNWGSVVDVFFKFQRRTKEEEMDSDMEFAVADNVIYTSRFHSISVTKELSLEVTAQPFNRLEFGEKGQIERLHWQHFCEPALKNDEVLVETRAFGINFKVNLNYQPFQ